MRASRCLIVFGLVAAGCGSDPADERLRFTLGTGSGPLIVDSICGATCGGADQLAVSIDYPNNQYREDEVIELLQYRVDYEIPRVDGEVPFFAGTVRVSLAPGESEDLSLLIAGTDQRAYVEDDVGGEGVAGVATLTFAGYDWDDGQVQVETEFDIRFTDLASSTVSEPTEPAGSADSGAANADAGDAGVGDGGADASTL